MNNTQRLNRFVNKVESLLVEPFYKRWLEFKDNKFIIQEEYYGVLAPLIDSYNIENLDINIESKLGRIYKFNIIILESNDIQIIKSNFKWCFIKLNSTSPYYKDYKIKVPMSLVKKDNKTFQLYANRPYEVVSCDNRLDYILKGSQIALLLNR